MCLAHAGLPSVQAPQAIRLSHLLDIRPNYVAWSRAEQRVLFFARVHNLKAYPARTKAFVRIIYDTARRYPPCIIRGAHAWPWLCGLRFVQFNFRSAYRCQYQFSLPRLAFFNTMGRVTFHLFYTLNYFCARPDDGSK